MPLLAPCALLLAVAAPQDAPHRQGAAAPSAPSLAFVGATVIPMDGSAAIADATVVTADRLVAAVGPSATTAVPDGARTVDARGCYLVPGLCDAHVHTLVEGDFALHLAHGVTTVVEMAGNPRLLELRRRIADGTVRGPRLFVAGPQLKVRADPFADTEVACATEEDAERLVRQTAADGYDFVKVWGPLSPRVHRRVCEAAAAAGIPVTGHVPLQVGLTNTVANGQQSIAHLEEILNKHLRGRDDEVRLTAAVEATRAAGVAVVTTLVTYENIARALAPDMDGLPERAVLRWIDPARRRLWGPDGNEYRRRAGGLEPQRFRDGLALQQRIAAALHAAGVRLVAGSDAGGIALSMIPGLALHRELELLAAAGLEPLQALVTATRNAGSFLGAGPPLGILAAGARADLVLLERDPRQDVANLRAIRGVMAAGVWLDRSALDGMLAGLARRNEATARFTQLALGEGAAAAAAALERAGPAEEPPFDEMPMLLCAFLLLRQGAAEEADQILRLVTRSHPEGYMAWFLRGVALEQQGEPAAARAAQEAVLQRCPGHRHALAALERLRQ